MIDWALVALVALATPGAAVLLARVALNDDRRPPSLKGTLTPNRQQTQNSKLKTQNYELPLLLIVSPLILFPSPFTLLALAVIPALWCIRRVTQGYFLPRTSLDWPIALMMAMLPVSLIVTFDMGFSLGKVALLIYGVALYYAIVDWTRTSARLYFTTNIYMLAGGLLATLGLFGTDWQHKVPGLSDIVQGLPQIAQRLSRDQTGFHPNIVAGALLWVALPLLALTWAAWFSRDRAAPYNSPRARIGLLVLLLLTAGTLLLTQSRSALISAFVGVGLLVWVAAPRLRAWLGGLLAVALVAAVLIGPAQLTGRIGDTTASQIGAPTATDNLIVRVQVWQSAFHAIADHPITGIGMDTFRRIMPVSYPAASVPDAYDIGHAHNQLLQAALDLGLPGLVGYLALWLVAATLAVKSYRVATAYAQRALAAGIGAALLASFLHGMTDAVALVSKPGIFFWALLGLNTALWINVRPALTTQRQPGMVRVKALAWWRDRAMPVWRALSGQHNPPAD